RGRRRTGPSGSGLEPDRRGTRHPPHRLRHGAGHDRTRRGAGGRDRPGDGCLRRCGAALVQLAHARGARVLALTSAGKEPAVREAGADETIDRGGDLWSEVQELAPGGLDAALDVVAGDLIEQGLPHLSEGGRWVVAGALGGYPASFDIRRLYLHNKALIGSSMHTPTHFALLADLARRGQVAPVVAAVFGLGDVHRAQAELASRSHVGKIVLTPGSR